MSRYLDLVRPTCQRIVQTLAEPDPSPETLISLPGVRGLEQFLEALKARGGDARAIEIASAAIQQFDAFLERTGGSQAKLAARLDAGRSGPEDNSLHAEAERGAAAVRRTAPRSPGSTR